MLVILQGSLRHFPPQQLLPFLGQHQRSGTLDVEARGRRARLFFRDGAVVWGESPAGNDAAAIVAALLGEEEAAFTFLDGLELPANANPAPIATDSLLQEAQRRALIARTFPDEARFGVVEAPAGKEISLKPEQFKLLFRIGSGRTFGELVADGGVTRDDLAASIRALEAAGLVVRIDQDGQPPAAASPKPEAQPAPAQPEPPQAAPPPAQETGKKQKKTMSESSKSLKKKHAGALTLSGPDATVYPLVANAYTIGRESGNDIVIADASVSSRHARIVRTSGGFTIDDLGSRNGTFVNGEPVKQTVALADNDMIRLGKIILTFNLAAELKHGETTKVKLGTS